MATGTGKTRTAIGLIYRLVKSGRFRRVLFLVDRTALGHQAFDAFEHMKLEQQSSANAMAARGSRAWYQRAASVASFRRLRQNLKASRHERLP